MRRFLPLSLYRPISRWLLVLAWAGLITFLSNQPEEVFEQIGLSGLLISILGHLFFFGVLMFLLVRALRVSTRLEPRKLYLSAYLIVALFGLLDEYHQSFVPGRNATLIDWLIDLSGAGAVWLILARQRTRRQHPDSTA